MRLLNEQSFDVYFINDELVYFTNYADSNQTIPENLKIHSLHDLTKDDSLLSEKVKLRGNIKPTTISKDVLNDVLPIGSVYLSKDQSGIEKYLFHFLAGVRNPFLHHVEKSLGNTFYISNHTGGFMAIPYKSVCSYQVDYCYGKISSITLWLKNGHNTSFNCEDHQSAYEEIVKYNTWLQGNNV